MDKRFAKRRVFRAIRYASFTNIRWTPLGDGSKYEWTKLFSTPHGGKKKLLVFKEHKQPLNNFYTQSVGPFNSFPSSLSLCYIYPSSCLREKQRKTQQGLIHFFINQEPQALFFNFLGCFSESSPSSQYVRTSDVCMLQRNRKKFRGKKLKTKRKQSPPESISPSFLAKSLSLEDFLPHPWK